MIKKIKSKHHFQAFQIRCQSVDDLNKEIAELAQISKGIFELNGAYTRFRKDESGQLLYGFEKISLFDWFVLEPGELALYSDREFERSYHSPD